LFAEEKYGRHTNANLLWQVEQNVPKNEELEKVIMLRGTFGGITTLREVMDSYSIIASDEMLEVARQNVYTHDVCNLQYTSGSTGHPKAAMLTHQ
jgi:long-subunit acyl-CoA synthetase (AMP-forming)